MLMCGCLFGLFGLQLCSFINALARNLFPSARGERAPSALTPPPGFASRVKVVATRRSMVTAWSSQLLVHACHPAGAPARPRVALRCCISISVSVAGASCHCHLLHATPSVAFPLLLILHPLAFNSPTPSRCDFCIHGGDLAVDFALGRASLSVSQVKHLWQLRRSSGTRAVVH